MRPVGLLLIRAPAGDPELFPAHLLFFLKINRMAVFDPFRYMDFRLFGLLFSRGGAQREKTDPRESVGQPFLQRLLEGMTTRNGWRA